MANKNNTRSFNWKNSINVGNQEFPTTLFSVEDSENNIYQRPVGVNAQGEYFTINNGEIQPIILQDYLPQIAVTGYRDKFFKHQMQEARKNLEKDTQDYLTQSNDNIMVNNVPHRTYNLNNYGRGLRGAESYALWRKEHPNQAMVEDAIAAAPFMLLGGAGIAGLGETALGAGIGSFMMNPYTQAAMDSYFLAHGINSVANGEANWQTALDFLPAYRYVKPAWETMQGINKTISDFTTSLGNNYRVGTGVVNTTNDVTNTANDMAKATRPLTMTDEALNSSREAANASREGMQPITGFTPVNTAANTTQRVKPVNTAQEVNTTQNANNNLFSSFDKVDNGGDDIIEYADMMDDAVDTYSNHSLFEGLHPTVQALEDKLAGKFTRHLSRAIAKGYGDEVAKVKIYNIDDPEQYPALRKIIPYLSKKYSMTIPEIEKFLFGSKGSAIENFIFYQGNKVKDSQLSELLSHELEHAIHYPETPLPSGIVDGSTMSDNYFDYFMLRNNNTEIGARISQLRDELGQTGNEPLTGSNLFEAWNKYDSNKNNLGNGMKTLFDNVIDWKKLADWGNKYSIGLMPLILGTAAYNYNNNNNKNK